MRPLKSADKLKAFARSDTDHIVGALTNAQMIIVTFAASFSTLNSAMHGSRVF
jgi:hypothetical protein